MTFLMAAAGLLMGIVFIGGFVGAIFDLVRRK
jgi:hypothetical protein